MTRNQQIEELLNQVPDEAMPQLVEFLRALTGQPRKEPEKMKTRSKITSVAQRTFGIIQADAATVRQALCEELYDLE
jgi:hypothetical protein